MADFPTDWFDWPEGLQLSDAQPEQQQQQQMLEDPAAAGLDWLPTSWAVHTLLFSALALCFVAPPTEVSSAGLTVQNLFRRQLASEQLQFVRHHLGRTALTLMLHSFLPLLYWLYMCAVFPQFSLFAAGLQPPAWQLRAAAAAAAVSAPVAGVCVLCWWTWDGFRHHPIASKLARAGQGNWADIASAIDVEFRRYDKFVTGQLGRQVIVTDNWLLQTSAYTLNAAHQSDLMLRVVSATEHRVSHEGGPLGAQILRMEVASLGGRFQPFELGINSAVYADFREKLSAPVTSAQSVLIRESLADQFVVAFSERVIANGHYREAGDSGMQRGEQSPEQCLGCMSRLADCRIAPGCDGTGGGGGGAGTCGGCRCRPMWCRACLARWFASRQLTGGRQPETWMSGAAPCPTCRAQFCVLDVFQLDRE